MHKKNANLLNCFSDLPKILSLLHVVHHIGAGFPHKGVVDPALENIQHHFMAVPGIAYNILICFMLLLLKV